MSHMTRREIAALCCRVVALVVLAWSLIYLVMMIYAFGAAIDAATLSRFGSGTSLFSREVNYFGSLGCALLLFSMMHDARRDLPAMHSAAPRG
jgi:hypothetical protein